MIDPIVMYRARPYAQPVHVRFWNPDIPNRNFKRNLLSKKGLPFSGSPSFPVTLVEKREPFLFSGDPPEPTSKLDAAEQLGNCSGHLQVMRC